MNMIQAASKWLSSSLLAGVLLVNTVTILAGLVGALLEESGMILSAFRWAWLSFLQLHTEYYRTNI